MNGSKLCLAYAAFLCCGMVLAAACAPQWQPSSEMSILDASAEAHFRGELRIALTADPDSLDCPRMNDSNASIVGFQLYNSLIWINEQGQLEPALAERWEVSAGGKAYTFHLRQGVVFHNGEPFTADSVVSSWERGIRPEMALSDRWAIVSSVEKIDDFTVRLHTEQPNALVLRTIAGVWCMIPPRYMAEVGEEAFLDHPIGTGPFMFEAWERDERIVLTANPNYWEAGLPKLARLIYRPMPEAFTRAAAVRVGEIDIANRLSMNDVALLENVAELQLIHYPVDRVYLLVFNNLTSGVGQPTESREVRLAMNYAIDRQGLLDAIYEGYGRPSTGLVTPSNLGYDDALQPFAYDPDKARQLLAAAGYPDGFSLDLACPLHVYIHFELVCQSIQDYLAAVGIETELEFMEASLFWGRESQKDLPPLFVEGWTGGFGEAYPRLFGALGGWDAPYSAWSDPRIDELLAQIRRTIDEEARALLYQELQGYMMEDPPFVYLYELETFEAVQRRVQHYQPRPSELAFFKTTSVNDGP